MRWSVRWASSVMSTAARSVSVPNLASVSSVKSRCACSTVLQGSDTTSLAVRSASATHPETSTLLVYVISYKHYSFFNVGS